MAKRIGSGGSRVPVVMASMLIAVCIVGARLYSSSAASAGLGEQISETCRSDSALWLPINGDRELTEATVREIGASLEFVEPARRGAFARPFFDRPRRLNMIWLDGADKNVTPNLTPLEFGEIALSATNMYQLQLEIGSTLNVGIRLTVTQQFDDVPFTPVPDFWCGYEQLFRPTAGGDPPPPSAIASEETIAALGEMAFIYDEYQITRDPITMTQAGELQRGYVAATNEWNTRFADEFGDLPRNELASVLQRARSVRTTVDRNLNPVLLIGLLADVVVLVAAAVLVARARRKELRLLAVRGVHPVRIAGSVAPGLAASVVGGTALGYSLAWAGVRLFGPSALVEPSALTTALVQATIAALVATIVVSAVVSTVADSYADPRRSRVATRVPIMVAVLGLVALAVIAFVRLDEHGGVRSSGVFSSGGDLLAMGFPLFAMLAVVTLIGLLLVWVVPRLRLTGSRLSRGLRLGWRRVVLEAGTLAAIVMSVALAAGCFIVAISLSDGAHLQLREKSEVYVGADLAVTIFDEVDIPAEWGDTTTLTSRLRAIEGTDTVDFLGVDPTTFAHVATLRRDAAELPLADLVASVAVEAQDSRLPALAVGADADIGDTVELVVPGAEDVVELLVVETANYFPGVKATVPMYVVAKQRLDSVASNPPQVLLIADAPDDAVETLRAGGVRTGLVLDVESSFDGSAYSALRWAYVPLAALGVLFAVVALSLQLLVISARREQRRIAHALMVRTGFRRRSAVIAALVETGLPLTVGTIIGAGAAMMAASLSIVRLDPMPLLDPPARFLVPWSVLAAAAAIVVVWTLIIALAIVRSTERSDPMRVFHGAA